MRGAPHRFKQIEANIKAPVIIQHDRRDIDKLPLFPAAAKLTSQGVFFRINYGWVIVAAGALTTCPTFGTVFVLAMPGSVSVFAFDLVAPRTARKHRTTRVW